MKKRMFIMLAAVFVFVAIVGGFKFFQIRAAMSHGAWTPPPETVTTVIAKPEQWNTSMNAIGSVAAVQGVVVSADLPGVVDQILFNSGQRVNRGDVLVRLDMRQESAQLVAAQAARELARADLERMRGMLAGEVVSQSQYDQAAAQFKQAEARVGEIRATLERKTISAPFSGVIGIRQVNLGQYLAPGTPIAPLQSLQPVYVNLNVPQQEVGVLHPGATLQVTSDAFEGTETGKINALDSVVDEATRNVHVQAIFDNRSLKMRPGMFVQVQLSRGASLPVVTIPTSAVSYAPFGDSVYIVEDVKSPDGKSTYRGVRQQFVKLGGARGDQVAVVTGLKPGEEVVTSGVFKLRPGAAVVVNNAVQPGNNPAPRPEDS